MYQFFLSEKGTPQAIKDVEKALADKDIKVGKRDIQRDLADMKKAGFLKSFGNRQNLKYTLSADQLSQMECECMDGQDLIRIAPEIVSTVTKAISQRRKLEIVEFYTEKRMVLEPWAIIAYKSAVHLLCPDPSSLEFTLKSVRLSSIKCAMIRRDTFKKKLEKKLLYLY